MQRVFPKMVFVITTSDIKHRESQVQSLYCSGFHSYSSQSFPIRITLVTKYFLSQMKWPTSRQLLRDKFVFPVFTTSLGNRILNVEQLFKNITPHGKNAFNI